MNQSIIGALTTVGDALATVAEPEQLALVAAQATAKALGCETAAVWLLAGQTRPRWLTHLEDIPGVEQVVRKLGFTARRDKTQDGSPPEDGELHLISTGKPQYRVWQRLFDRPVLSIVEGLKTERRSLAVLTGGQVTSAAELAAMPSRALRVNGSGSGEGPYLVAGLFHADEPIGVLACEWLGADAADSFDRKELLVVCLASYLGQVLGGRSGSSPETELYLAGTGLLLTALDVGPPAAKECAEVVTRCALEMAAEEDLRPAEAQSLQWAALFHEVGWAPMDRWLTFPAPDDAGGTVESESADPPCLTLIPNLSSAASLLAQVTPVLDGEDGDLGTDVGLPAKLLATACLSNHCGVLSASKGRQALPSAEPATPSSDGESP